MRLAILGGGGHARIVIDAAVNAGQFEVYGVFDDRESAELAAVAGIPLLGKIVPADLRRHRISLAIIAVGDNRARQAVFRRISGEVRWATVIHDRAWVSPSASIGEGTIVCAGAVVQSGARIGRHAVINTSSSVDHDCQVADFAQVGPGAHLGGEAVVKTGAFIGIGASILPRVRIGEWSKVGAGAVVIRNLPADVTAVGVPAQIISERDRPGEC